MNNPLNVLGLALRAGKLVSGDEVVMKAVRRKEARLVVIASDASDGTLKKYRDKCHYYDIPLVQFGTRAELGHHTGKAERVVIALTDAGFSELLRKKLQTYSEVTNIEQTGQQTPGL